MISRRTTPKGQRAPIAALARLTGLAALVTAWAVLCPARSAYSQTSIATPAATGDQLLFFYDAREGRVPFLGVSNPSDETVEIEVAFYPSSLEARLGTASFQLPPAGNVVIDPTLATVADGAANGNAGLAVVTPIAGGGDRKAVVPPQALAGSFTLANTALAAAFGESALGRLAVSSSGQRAAAGSTVDGSKVKYQRLAPQVLMIPMHFNPQTLAPPEQDGNRVVLAAFNDSYGTPFEISAAADAPGVTFHDASGFRIAETTVALDGVLLTDLQALAGSTVLAKSGKVFVDVTAGSANVLGLFSQALGTFASGQRMPAVDSVPAGLEPPLPTPTPTSTPSGSPSPTPTGGGVCSSTASFTISIAYDPSVTDLSGVTAEIDYPASLSVPGLGSDPSVTERVTNLTGVSGGLFQVGDDDSTISVGLVSLTTPIPQGSFALVRFDCTSGSPLPAASALTCTTAGSDFLGLDVDVDCTLSIASP